MGKAGRGAATWLPIVLVACALAGCTDDSPDAETATLGSIRGVLLDERFRPIELMAGPPTTEFQARGTILVTESGDTLRTTENGEFASPPLAPGTYTLRADVEDHEATPVRVQVVAGQVAETSLIARRVVNLDDFVATWDLAVFIPCNLTVLVQPVQGDCFLDQSGDTGRYFMELDFTGFQDAQFMLTELYLNKDAGEVRHGSYQVQITGASLDGVTTNNYAIKALQNGQYDRILIERGVESEWHDEPLLTYSTWEEMGLWTWYVSGQGLLRKELVDAGSPFGQGVGPQLGLKAQMLVTMFYGDDRAAAEAFCGLCV